MVQALTRLLKGTSAPVIAAVVTSLLWLALIYREGASLQMNLYEIASTIVAIGSLVFNYVQYIRDRDRLGPIKNALIGLFHDLRSRQMRCYVRMGRLQRDYAKVQSPEISAFEDFIEEMQIGMEQLREHLTGLVKSVAPALSEADMLRAQDMGLRPEDVAIKDEWNRQSIERLKQQGQDAALAQSRRYTEQNRTP